MNRALVFGIAIFFAVVGIALIGGESKVLAGHGCNGCACSGCNGCDCGCAGPACCGPVDCCGCHGRRHHRHHRRHRCCGKPCCGVPCCGPVAPSCCGAAPAEAAAPAAPEAPAAPAPAPAPSASLKRSFGFRTVSFRN